MTRRPDAWLSELGMDDVSIDAAAFDVATPFVPRKRFAASSAEGSTSSLKSIDERTMAIPSLAPGENWTGTENADVRAGSELDDQLKGLGGDDQLWGEDGADTLNGGLGADTLHGGDGSDWITFVDAAADSLGLGVTVDLAAGTGSHGEAAGDVYDGIENIYGSLHRDHLTGNDEANVIDGGAGNDTLVGGGGDDRLDGSFGLDSLVGGAGSDTLIGGAGGDTLVGGTRTADTEIDWVSYELSPDGVTVNLVLGLAAHADASGDQLIGIEAVIGSGKQDELLGSDGQNTLRGGADSDKLDGGRGNDILEGGAGLDVIYGGEGDDELYGGDGDDALTGGEGADKLVGGYYDANGTLVDTDDDEVIYLSSIQGVVVNLATNINEGGDAAGDTLFGIEDVAGTEESDSLTGDAIGNFLRGGGGDDTLDGGDGTDELVGGEGDDLLIGGDLADLMSGGSENDTLIGGAGIDDLYGGDGTDWASYEGSSVGVTVSLADGTGAGGDADGDELTSIENLAGSSHGDTLTGDEYKNTLLGHDGNDALDGGAEDDTLWGGAGDDWIAGGFGVDEMKGEGGNDTLVGGAEAEAMDGGADSDWVTYDSPAATAGVTVNLATGTGSGGDAQGDTYSGIERVRGSAHADALTGDAGANELLGMAGDDILVGGAGADTLNGGTEFDIVTYAHSGEAVHVNMLFGLNKGGDAEGDRLSGIEQVVGSIHDDSLQGNAAQNTLEGGNGNDTLQGGGGADSLVGGEGWDWISYAQAVSLSQLGVSVDLLAGTVSGTDATGDVFTGIENVIGSGYADTIVGGNDANHLHGLGGGDTLLGGLGNDILDGGEGADTADYSGALDDYVILKHDGGESGIYYTIRDTRAGADGADLLRNIESLRFANSGGTSETHTLDDTIATPAELPTLSIAAAEAEKPEGNAGTTLLTFTVTRSSELGESSAAWSLSGLAEDDVAAMAGTVAFEHGDAEKTVTVEVVGDLAVEPDETFTITLSELEGATLGTASAQGTILNDDAEPPPPPPPPPPPGGGNPGGGNPGGGNPGGGNPPPSNQAPGGLSLSGGAVRELAAGGTLVGTLSASDPDGHALSYALLDSAGGRFKIVGDRLLVDNGFKLDFEQARAHAVTVQVADGQGGVQVQRFTVAVGDLKAERTRGSAGDDVFKAGKYRDVLAGGGGDDVLWGGSGKDVLTGGRGKDAFVFASKPHKRKNLDKIKDFKPKDDAIWLDNRYFKKLGKKGSEERPKKLKKAFFTVGEEARDRNDYLVFDKKKGILYYDVDGSGARDAVAIAVLKKNLKGVTHKDFFVV